jgi:histidine triad (HIT) family protein
MKYLVAITAILLTWPCFSQSLSIEAYKEMKAKKLAEKSPFEKILDRELPATIVYETETVIAFVPLRPQAPVHYLIVPKKRINTVNDVTEADLIVLGQLLLAAKEVAKKFGIDETGYRLAINTNRDAGQSEFHLHMHLLGGEFLGPMTNKKTP